MSKEITAAEVANKALDKSQVLIEKVAESATDIFSAAAGIVSKGVAQYGEQAIDAVLWVVRIDAMQSLLSGLIMFILTSAVLRFIWTGFSKRNWSDKIKSSHSEEIYFPIAVVTVVVSFFLGVSLSILTDVWKYVAIAKPEIYLVKKTIDIVEKKLEEPAKK